MYFLGGKINLRRIKEIDVLKGIGIILMVIGHLYPNTIVDKWLHAFHMPLFFIISGFLYTKKKNFSQYFFKKCYTLLLPYMFIGGIHLIIMLLINVIKKESIDIMIRYIYHFLWMNSSGLPICGAIWFLTAIFFTDIIFIFIDIKIKNTKLKNFLYALSTIIGILLSYFNIRLPLSLDVSLVGIGLFCIGKSLHNIYSRNQIDVKFRNAIIVLFIMILPIMYNDTVNLRMGVYGNIFLFFINSIVMTICLFFISTNILKYINKIGETLACIGENSIIYLGFNQFVIILIKNIPFFYLDIGLFSLLIKFVFITITLVILHYVSIFFNKGRLKFLIGKYA